MKSKPDVLLLGNGINKAFGQPSWGELLSSFQGTVLDFKQKKALAQAPYPLQAVILSNDRVDEQMKKASEKLAEISPSDEEKKLLRRFAELPIDAILTTNYTYELEKALAHDFACSAGRRCRYRTCRAQTAGRYEKQQLHTCFEISEDTPLFWVTYTSSAWGWICPRWICGGSLASKSSTSRTQGSFCTSPI